MSESTSGLVERIEAATGPDRDLDEAIALATGWHTFTLPMFGKRWQRGDGTVERAVPFYTSSIDAARTLIPKPWLLGTLSDHSKGRWGACLTIPMKWDCGTIANGPALALCAAALRALTPLPSPTEETGS